MAQRFNGRMELTEKARELFRQRDRAEALKRLKDLDWAVKEEFWRQRAAGFRVRDSDLARDGLFRLANGALPKVWTTEKE